METTVKREAVIVRPEYGQRGEAFLALNDTYREDDGPLIFNRAGMVPIPKVSEDRDADVKAMKKLESISEAWEARGVLPSVPTVGR